MFCLILLFFIFISNQYSVIFFFCYCLFIQEIKQLKSERSSLQGKIQATRYLVTDLQNKLAQHKCIINNGSGFNYISTFDHTYTLLDSSDISSVLSSDLLTS